MSILIKNGKIVLEDSIITGDIYIENDKITQIGTNLFANNDNVEIIDAQGLTVIPGGIDVHTHFNIDVGVTSVDDFYTGTVAAACGGTTTIIDHMGFGPKGCDQYHQLNKYHEFAEGNAVIDYSFHGVVQHLNDEIFEQIEDLALNKGIKSFKLYMTYNYKMNNKQILKFLKKTKDLDIIMCIHAEIDEMINELREKFKAEHKLTPIYHAKSRPDYTESKAIKQLIKLAEEADNHNLYIVHVSSCRGVNEIRFKKDSFKIFSETCPQYLILDESKYSDTSNNNQALKYILSPPLRTHDSNIKLWRGLEDGTIDTVATDHCSFNFMGDKQLGKDDFTKCPNGIPGVETRVPLIFSEGVMKERVSLRKFVDVISTNPAKIFGLYPQKGVIRENSDADIVIIDPEDYYTIKHVDLHENVDYTCYEDIEVKGKIKYTISRGEIIVKDNEFLAKKGRGCFIKRK